MPDVASAGVLAKSEQGAERSARSARHHGAAGCVNVVMVVLASFVYGLLLLRHVVSSLFVWVTAPCFNSVATKCNERLALAFSGVNATFPLLCAAANA